MMISNQAYAEAVAVQQETAARADAYRTALVGALELIELLRKNCSDRVTVSDEQIAALRAPLAA